MALNRNLDEVLIALDTWGVDAARGRFEEEFGAKPKAAADSEITPLLADALKFDRLPEKVEVPLHTLVAVMLLEGFGGRGKGSGGTTDLRYARELRFMELRIKPRYEELMAKGLTEKDAQEQLVAEFYRRTTLSENQIRDRELKPTKSQGQ